MDEWVHTYFVEIPDKALFTHSYTKLMHSDEKEFGNPNLTVWQGYCFRYAGNKRNSSLLPEALKIMFTNP